MGQAKLKREAREAKLRPGPSPPLRMLRLPIDERGFIVPFFVQWFDDARRATPAGTGTPDFRVVNANVIRRVLREQRCWICGDVFHRHELPTSVVGPMCTVNRISAEPPSHRECARYAAQVCPFLTKPRMKRNPKGLPEERNVPGIMIERNPGVVAVWTSRQVLLDPATSLFHIGDPVAVEWWAEGREATREEVMASFTSGVAILRDVCDQELTHELRTEAYAALEDQLAQASLWLPAA